MGNDDIITVTLQCWKGCEDVEFTIARKPSTRYRFICPKCRSATYVVVTENLDILIFNENDKCEECNGTGVCKECNGKGEVTCPVCNGIGVVIDSEIGVFRLDDPNFHELRKKECAPYLRTCPKCANKWSAEGVGGTGILGSSILDPYKLTEAFNGILKGRGLVKCESCGGSGKCPECGGIGFRM